MPYDITDPAAAHRLQLEGREKLTVAGELHVDGRIDALTYEDAPETRGGGLFSRLFG